MSGKKRKKTYPDIFSTGEVAKICQTSQQTIIKCFDKGKLKGFRVPGSRFRRVPLRHLIEFLKENGLSENLLPKNGENEEQKQ